MITPERLLELRTHYGCAATVDYACAAIVELLDEVEGLTASRNYGRDIINDMSLEAADMEKCLPVWVPFAQAQPLHKSDVLLCREQDKAVVLGNYLAFDQWNRPNMCVVGGGFNTMDKFTHWMPLPVAPNA